MRSLLHWTLFALAMADWTTPAPAAQPVLFKHVVVDSQYPHRPHCKTAGDINGDGFADVIVASSSWGLRNVAGDTARAGLFWYESPNWTKHRIDGGDFTTDVQAADIDGDGDLDIIIPKIITGVVGQIVWYENPRPKGDPAKDLWKMHVIHPEKAFHHDVEVGDINGDGRLDVVTRGEETRVFLQTAPDTWTRVVIPTGGRGGTALADLDGDGDLDIVENGYWLECPKDPVHDRWVRDEIAAGWPDDAGVSVADMNKDGRPDVLFSPAESQGRLCWYEASADPKRGPWIEHVIDADVDHIHTFKVADMNNDGELDLVTSEMEQSPCRRVSVYWNLGKLLTWRQQVVSTNGSHNIRVADLNHDGYLDIIGANHGNYGGPTPVEVWLNRTDPKIGLDRWTYIHADDSREPAAGEKAGDFGIGFGDLNNDGYQDIASGHYFYRNPGGDMTKTPWPRVALPKDPQTGKTLDAGLLFSVTGKGPPLDILAEDLPNVVWLHANDPQGNSWTTKVVAQMPPVRHGNGRTIKLTHITAHNKRADILLSGGGGTWLLQIPAKPDAGNWPIMKITTSQKDEQKGIGIGDVDRDGHLDLVLAAGIGLPQIDWWRNPDDGSANWMKHTIGNTTNMAKMMELADINGDGRLDVVATDSEAKICSVFWFEAPADPVHGQWVRHEVAAGYNGLDSLSVADMNEDGLPDIVIGETKDQHRLVIYENLNGGKSWKEHAVDRGKESHKGALAVDLDGDGHLDLVSIAYFGFKDLHLWRNDNGKK